MGYIDEINVGGIDSEVRDTGTRKTIAPTETTLYASKAYAKDAFFIWDYTDGKVYQATAAIAKDAQFVVGTNCMLVGDVGDAINAAVTAEESARISAINSEASTRATADTALETRIDQIVAPTGEAPNPAEITDARIGADGVVHQTLGGAIRNQVESSEDVFNKVFNDLLFHNKLSVYRTHNGYGIENTGIASKSYTNCKILKYQVSEGDVILIDVDDSASPVKWLFKSSSVATKSDNNVGPVHTEATHKYVTVPEGASYIFISILSSDNNSGVYSIEPSLVKFRGFPHNIVTIRDAINISVSGDDVTLSSSTNWCGAIYNETKIGSVSKFVYMNSPFQFTFPSSDTYFIVCDYDSGTWSLKTRGAISETECVLCLVYKKKIIPLDTMFTGDIGCVVTPRTNCGFILSGPIFAFISGEKLRIRCASTARLVYNNETINCSGWTLDATISSSTNALLLCFNNESFYLVNRNDVSSNDCVIGVVYKDCVYAFNKYIIANHLPIGQLYQRTDIPLFVNQKKLHLENYVVGSSNNNYCIELGDVLKLMNAFSDSALYYFDKYGVRYDSIPVNHNEIDVSNKKILTIGDSITNRGWYQKRLLDHVPSLTFVGTNPTQKYPNIYAEGYSGSRASHILASPTINGSPNPFWSNTLNRCDFGYYCTTQNIYPDIVIIEFGINENDSDEYRDSILNFIQTIYDYDSTIKVYVIQPFGDAETMPANSHKNKTIRSVCQKCVLESYSFEHCVLIPCHFIMVDEYDYPSGTIESYGYNVQIPGLTDSVHPSENVGFAKLGDMIFNYLGI